MKNPLRDFRGRFAVKFDFRKYRKTISVIALVITISAVHTFVSGVSDMSKFAADHNPLGKVFAKEVYMAPQTTIDPSEFTAAGFNRRLQKFIQNEKELLKQAPANLRVYDSQVEDQVNNNIHNFTKSL